MTRNELLERAANIIRERGFTKNKLVDRDTGAVCIYGALNVAYNNDTQWTDMNDPNTTTDPAVKAATHALDACAKERGAPWPTGGPWGSIHEVHARVVGYNNHPDTTAEDMFALIECAEAKPNWFSA